MTDFQLSDLTPEQRVAFIQTPFSASLGMQLTGAALECVPSFPIGPYVNVNNNSASVLAPRSRSGSSDNISVHSRSSLSSGAGPLSLGLDATQGSPSVKCPQPGIVVPSLVVASGPTATAATPAAPTATTPTADTASSHANRRNGGSNAPVSLLLHAESLEEAAIMTEYYCFTVPKKMRKATTRLYRQADQVAIFVAVNDVIVARAVMASDALPRSVAARNIPHVEAFVPDDWTNLFRVTNIVCFNERAMQLAFPCPVSDRSELPSAVDAGMHIARVWQMTLSSFLESTISIATGKCEHYDALLNAIVNSDPDEGVPADVKALVSAVKMISHGPGIVMLGYIARRYGRLGREFVANSLFELNSGVIDLCRQTMGGALISYLVRHGTCATPKILQLVPWRVVASRVLSDAVGSQTASLMLHSAIHFHRSTRHSLEPVALTSLTHRVLTRNLADATDPNADCTISSIAANAQSCRVLQLVIEACVELGAMQAAGIVNAPPDIIASANKVIFALCDLADKHACDAWGNYATQSLISACSVRVVDNEEPSQTAAKGQFFDVILSRVMDVIRPQLVRLSCHKCGSNVIEKLCSSRPNISEQVTQALLSTPGSFSRLASDRYGNYVVQTLLQHLPRSLEPEVREALLPALSTLDPHWHCSVAISSWCRTVEERQLRGAVVGKPAVPSQPIVELSSSPASATRHVDPWRTLDGFRGPLAPM